MAFAGPIHDDCIDPLKPHRDLVLSSLKPSPLLHPQHARHGARPIHQPARHPPRPHLRPQPRQSARSDGCVITKGCDEKFWCTGLELDELEANPFANSDGFFPLLATLLDYPFPTIALLTGHTFGGACPFALAHDYRIMNSERGFFSMQMVLWMRLQRPRICSK